MQKRNLKAKICRLCLNTKCDIDLKVIEVIKEVLEIVLPKLNLEEGDEHLICSSCSVKLFAAFNFKSVCTDTEDTIFPYVNSQETSLVDLREIYLKEKGDVQLIDILGDQKICRLCFQLVGYGFVSLNEVDADIIDNYIPEVNFNATKDPVICKLCSDSLVTHGTFLNSCLAAQEENRKVCGDPAEDRECCIKTEEIKIEDDWESYPPTRLENVETIKNFRGRCNSKNIPVKKNVTYTCNRCNFKTVHKYSLKRHCLTHVSLTTTDISPQCESESRDASSPCPLEGQVRMFQCQKCPYRTHLKDTFACHWSTHEMPSEAKVYQCEICHYRVTRKEHFRRHQLRHEDNAETIDNFKSRLTFENISVITKKRLPRKVRTYTCNSCDFKTVRKYNLNRHRLTHVSLTTTYISLKSQCESESRDASSTCPLEGQVLMFQCQKCPYRTHLKDTFACHWSTHEMPSEVKVYQCEICHYRVTQKEYFRRHQLRHKDSGETIDNFKSRLSFENISVITKKRPPRKIRTYRCNRCDFKTTYKNSLKRHCWIHISLTPTYVSLKSQRKSQSRDTSARAQMRIFQCEKCPYKTRARHAFMSHWDTHKVPSHVKVYQCEKCHYRVTREDRFRHHQLRHENSAEKISSENIRVRKITLKCDVCSYQTVWRPNLIRHQLRHKKKCEVKTYDCCKCSFRTKYRDSLKRHELLHRL